MGEWLESDVSVNRGVMLAAGVGIILAALYSMREQQAQVSYAFNSGYAFGFSAGQQAAVTQPAPLPEAQPQPQPQTWRGYAQPEAAGVGYPYNFGGGGFFGRG